jgi:hypothetical protein
MATDKSEPRVGLIIKVGVVAVVVLVGVHSALIAYFDRIVIAEETKKTGGKSPELTSVRNDEKARLSSGPVPIEAAMQQLAARGRMGASPELVPTASRDVSPLQGWTKMPSDVPAPMMAAATAASAPAAAGDAGAADAAPSTATDSGTKKQP